MVLHDRAAETTGTDASPLRPPFPKAGHPLIPAVIVALATAAFALLRLAVVGHGRIERFFMAGSKFVNPARVPKGLPIVPGNGYDGQFFYRLGLDPANVHVTAFGITMYPLFRLQRIGYPVLAWAASLGHHSWVPVTLVVVNGLALAAVAYLGGLAARQAGRHPLWGLLLAGYFGFVFSVGRDTAEPVEAALLVAGLLAYRRRRPVLAGVLLACGSLTRETVLVAVGALALTRLYEMVRGRARPGREEAAWIIPPVAFVAWQVVVRTVIGHFPLTSDANHNLTAPFDGLYHGIKGHLSVIWRAPLSGGTLTDWLWVAQVLALGALVVVAFRSIRSTEAPVHERVALVAYVLELCVLSGSIWEGVVDLRSLDEVYVLAVLLLIALPRRAARVLPAAALWLSPVVALVVVQRILTL